MPAEQPDPAMALLNSAGTTPDRINHVINFGWEYVWHCHLLGHEENDMMRPMVLQVAPETPMNLVADGVTDPLNVVLTWTDNSASETGFVVERDVDPAFSSPVTLPSVSAGIGWGGTMTSTDAPQAGVTVFYRVKAINSSAFAPPATTTTLESGWSNVVSVGLNPSVTVTPSTLTFPDQLVGLVSTAQTVTINNAGPGTLVFVGAAVTGLDSGDFTLTNSCGSTLAPLGTCTASVAFTPSAIGVRAANLVFTTNDPLNIRPTVALSGVGVSALLVLAPAAISFGDQPLNTTTASPLTVTVSNAGGTAPLVIDSIGFGGANVSEFALTQSCGAMFPVTVATGATCSIGLTFTPAAAGNRSAFLNVSAKSPAISQSVSLSGNGTTSKCLSVAIIVDLPQSSC